MYTVVVAADTAAVDNAAAVVVGIVVADSAVFVGIVDTAAEVVDTVADTAADSVATDMGVVAGIAAEFGTVVTDSDQ